LRYNQRTEVGPLLEEKCGCKVVLINDGKAAAEAEFRKGSLMGCQNAAVFVIGTGVGGGLIVNGEVVLGKDFSAGEFSFINIDNDHFGMAESCLGNLCSATALLKKYEDKTGEAIEGREFFRRLDSDDKAKQALDEFACNVAKQIYNLYWLLDLEKIAIGGGISKQKILVDKIREKFRLILNDCFIPYFPRIINVEIVPAAFGNDANLIGAFLAYQRKGN
jgi:predicted NBD/HSP70 family sugar kinase